MCLLYTWTCRRLCVCCIHGPVGDCVFVVYTDLKETMCLLYTRTCRRLCVCCIHGPVGDYVFVVYTDL